MMEMDFKALRQHLNRFDFGGLFIESLGWSQPLSRKAGMLEHDGTPYKETQLAQLGGVVVIEIEGDSLPDDRAMAALHKTISGRHFENLLIFVDKERTKSVWYWVKREGNYSALLAP